jgi:hypothetical protein
VCVLSVCLVCVCVRVCLCVCELPKVAIWIPIKLILGPMGKKKTTCVHISSPGKRKVSYIAPKLHFNGAVSSCFHRWICALYRRVGLCILSHGGFVIHHRNVCSIVDVYCYPYQVLCDEFFVPALNILCEKLSLSDDVAGPLPLSYHR